MTGRTKQRTIGRKSRATSGQKKKKKKNNGGGRRKANPYVQMVLDPCGSTLLPGLYGSSEGLLSRLKSTYQIPALEGTGSPASLGSTCGYVIWCPDYCSDDPYVQDAATGGNLYVWQSADPSAHPENSAAIPYGSVRDTTLQGTATTKILPDPAGQLVKSDIVSDARVLNACMQMTYFGRMKDSSGEVGFISGLPIESILSKEPASVNDLLAYATNKHRLGIDTLENVYRPNDGTSEHFRDSNDNAIDNPIGELGTSDPAVVSDSASNFSPRFFGFVWRNTKPDAGLTFDFTKSIEWRAEPGSGITQVPIKTSGRSLIPLINSAVDKHKSVTGSNLWERIKGGIESATSQIAKIAFTGTGQAFLNGGGQKLAEIGFQQGLQRAMPLMLM